LESARAAIALYFATKASRAGQALRRCAAKGSGSEADPPPAIYNSIADA